MKKVLAIFLSLLFVSAVLHISVATHYCGGKEVAATVSISGKLASCGMSCPDEGMPFQGTSMKSHCCEDIVAVYGIDNDYTPSFSFMTGSYQYNFRVLAVSAILPERSQADTYPIFTNISPPGALMSTRVDLSGICVFRI